MMLATRMQAIKESPTLAVTAHATKLREQGFDIINLGAGEPDFDTPLHIKLSAKNAIDAGMTKYTAVGGIHGLKRAIVGKFKNDNNLEYTENEVIVGVGGKQCIFNGMLALLNHGDKVIIPAPYWVSYSDIALIAGATPVIVECGITQNFKITPEQLARAITPHTKLFILNSPSNPTGSVYSLSELKDLAQVLRQNPQVWILTDDMYEHINLSGLPFVNILNADISLKQRTIVVNGVSKAYAMTGWRIGYAAARTELIQAMEILQSQSTSNPTSISQVAAQSALEGDQSCIIPMIAAFRERHAYVVARFNQMSGLHCLPSEGAFYAFPSAQKAIVRLYQQGKITEKTDVALSKYLLQHGVAVVPGTAFGAEGYFRISFATSMDNLRMALDRIENAL